MNMNYIVAFITAFVVIAGAALLGSLPLYFLWNWLMPVLFKLPEITWLQALGIGFLANILFKPTSVKVNKD